MSHSLISRFLLFQIFFEIFDLVASLKDVELLIGDKILVDFFCYRF